MTEKAREFSSRDDYLRYVASLIELVNEMLAHEEVKGFKEAQRLYQKYWIEDNPMLGVIRSEVLVALYTKALHEVLHDILLNENPLPALREKLISDIYREGQYLVVLIPAEPAYDGTGFRGRHTGVSGEMSKHLLDLVKACSELPNWELCEELTESLADAQSEITNEYVYLSARVHLFTDLHALFSPSKKPFQWTGPCLAAACALWEQFYREVLGLPFVIKQDRADETYYLHSAVLKFAQEGVNDPFEAALAATGSPPNETRH